MGIYIKGMEMPKSCITCPLCECRNECAYCEVGDKYLSWDWDERLRSSRNDHCPLTEVLPHGRLIDADALLESIKEARKKDPEIEEVYIDDYFMVAEWVASAPTIIESDIDVMYYPQVDGITPTVIKTKAEDGT